MSSKGIIDITKSVMRKTGYYAGQIGAVNLIIFGLFGGAMACA